ncbi:MAG: phosphoglycerate dehydrogenase [Methanocalculus sp. MSAO_Arc1]|uniref:phosphoglycerate dehydrogenase n=1 Tax=Methanocalculus TaxID=71151 RepID=UPI000FEEE2F3|nr:MULTISPECIES: phosphoglycerate dehydrogenase [unclassified Methanocalculus]RQD81238.1 MAG: phosphoglycerate dehydrogenase [Methanocalculus sp. MSAO_Arc1]
MKFNVLVSDPLAEEGISILRGFCNVDEKSGLSEDELVAIIGQYDALIVRSGTEVTARVIDAAPKMKYIGRAGAGVDNIDTDAATRKGIIVANAPEGNTLAATEHTMAMILSLARRIPSANASMKKGEWKRSAFMGVEMNEKVIGIVGFGRIGREVAKRAQSFDMRVVAYDPFITAERGAQFGVEMMSVEDLFRVADVITVHTPLIKETKHLINEKSIATMKDGVRIINCARGGIIDEMALAEAVKSGKVAGAALDVFEEEPPANSPLLDLDTVIVTPHLGASTVEAQKNVAISIAHQCIDVLKGGAAKYVVNAPMIPPDLQDTIEPYARLAEKMGRLASQVLPGAITKIDVTYAGDLAEMGQNLKFVTRMAIKGILDPILQMPVNIVNAGFITRERGIAVSETTTEESHGFKNQISLTVRTKDGSETIIGSVFGKDRMRIVGIGSFTMDLVPEGSVVIAYHIDRPGVIGPAATVLGKHTINIAGMQVGRVKAGEEALMVLNVDSDVPETVMDELRSVPGINRATFATL